MRVVLGVGGGIAAYKVASLLRLFTEAGHNVTVIPTEAATRFVGVATWEALSGNPVSNSVFDDVEKVNHVRLGQQADLMVVAPATADLLAKAAAGLADDLLTNTLLMASGPVLFAPAMHTEMWQNGATQANVATLRSRGITVLDPASGRLTGPDSGPGRLPDPEDIFAAALRLAREPVVAQEPLAGQEPLAAQEPLAGQEPQAGIDSPQPAAPSSGSPAPAEPGGLVLAGRTVTITAGGTREPLDPVRFLGNRSSGKQGVALAAAALEAGARVRLICAHIEVPAPDGAQLVTVETALQLQAAVAEALADSDVVIMAAAVADFRPAEASGSKIKKRDDVADPVITLVRNPDILAGLVQERNAAGGAQLIVGFAAETGDERGGVLDYGRAKLERKGCDLLVVNEVGSDKAGAEKVFGQDSNRVVILDRRGNTPVDVSGSKIQVARAVVGLAAQALQDPSRQEQALQDQALKEQALKDPALKDPALKDHSSFAAQ
ncbi:MAG TPA: bifunctional phosphopantothenoylcysteine decarboxylase/phosphopantothenate synthase [Micrococcaceae bacterium]|nr:bifunctional phosphopantothenoylcysteine decarboxylase/phosphopantothenate synthase [Micrococcaceae bacterium]